MSPRLVNMSLDNVERALLRGSGTTVHYPKGYTIWAAGDPADRVYMIEKGWVKIYRLSIDGRRVTVGSIRSPGEMMGIAEALWDRERTCFAAAINELTMVILRTEKFEELMATHSFLAIKIARLLGARMGEAEGIIHEMVSWQTPGRLALTLLKMGERCGEPTRGGIRSGLKLTHEELANMIGAPCQTVTSFLNTF